MKQKASAKMQNFKERRGRGSIAGPEDLVNPNPNPPLQRQKTTLDGT